MEENQNGITFVRIINRLEAMTKDGGNLKRNFEREGVVVAEVA